MKLSLGCVGFYSSAAVLLLFERERIKFLVRHFSDLLGCVGHI
nr:MAG TPA: hypothetical protein [Caudoviricetes sp.]